MTATRTPCAAPRYLRRSLPPTGALYPGGDHSPQYIVVLRHAPQPTILPQAVQ